MRKGKLLALLTVVIGATVLAFAAAADASTAVGNTGCTIAATKPAGSPQKVGVGTLRCGWAHHNVRMEVCAQQLVTGGWENVPGTCLVSPVSPGGAYNFVTFSGHFTAVPGRYYRTWAWGYVNGPTGISLSNGVKF